MWRVVFTEAARKQLRKLDAQAQERIEQYVLHRIAPMEDPRSFGKMLKFDHEGLWRYRVGDYRIICKITDNDITVTVVKVGHRKHIYE